MRRYLVILVCTFFAVINFTYAADPVQVWNRANNFYKQKQYDSAAVLYEQLAATKPNNADLYYNLGNTYYRLNKIGLAVLNYERSLEINPENKNASDNLLLTHNRITNNIHKADDIFFVQWWNTITSAQKANMWAIICLLSIVLIVSLFVSRYAMKASIPVQLPWGLSLLTILLLIIANTAAHNATHSSKAVVMVNDAPLMAKDLSGKPLVIVPEGTTVTIGDTKSDWIEVVLPDGRKGWMQLNLINKI